MEALTQTDGVALCSEAPAASDEGPAPESSDSSESTENGASACADSLVGSVCR